MTITTDTDNGLYVSRTLITLDATTKYGCEYLGEREQHDEARVQVSPLGTIQLGLSAYGHTHGTPVGDNSGTSAYAVTCLTPQEARAIAIELLKVADAAEAQA